MSRSKNKARSKASKRRKRTRSTRSNIPAAQSSQNKSRFTTQSLSGSSVRVRGYDLVYSSSEDSVTAEGAFCVIPCNPAYWTGTRVARVATAYSQYRPLRFNVHYFPQVSTMTNGLVTGGTIWNNDTSPEAIQQALATSNSGKIYPVYTKATHNVDLKSCLSQNLFTFSGYISNETNPFLFVALTQHYEGISPGYYMVEYEYDFKNPIGEGAEYDTSTRSVGEIGREDVWENTTAVLMSSSLALSIGTTLIVKLVEGAIQFFLDGSRLGMAANLVVKLFKSRMPNAQSIITDLDYSQLVSGKLNFSRLVNANYIDYTVEYDHIYLSYVHRVEFAADQYYTGIVFLAPDPIPGDGLFSATFVLVSAKSGNTFANPPAHYAWYSLRGQTVNNEDVVFLFSSANVNAYTNPSATLGINFAGSLQASSVVCTTDNAISLGVFILPDEPNPTLIIGKGSRKVLSKRDALCSRIYEARLLEN